MKKYKVITQFVTFGVGIVLKLSAEQAATRMHALNKKGKDTFEVKEPVQFKQGEIVSVVKGTLSRFLEDRLEELDKKGNTIQPTPPETIENTDPADDDGEDFPKMTHVRFGQYDVFDKDGNKVNQELLKKEEAALLLEELLDDDTENGV
ncbi:MAG: hypothetical protein ACTSXQ_06120 [Alphaproteobacteria bacterium]